MVEAIQEGPDFAIDSGARDATEQARLIAAGRSQTTHSKHLHSPSLAVDISPFPINWVKVEEGDRDEIAKFHLLGGYVLGIAHPMDIDLRWGGDWDGDWSMTDQTFNDLGHFELKR